MAEGSSPPHGGKTEGGDGEVDSAGRPERRSAYGCMEEDLVVNVYRGDVTDGRGSADDAGSGSVGAYEGDQRKGSSNNPGRR